VEPLLGEKPGGGFEDLGAAVSAAADGGHMRPRTIVRDACKVERSI
jgi:hypothetical protein